MKEGTYQIIITVYEASELEPRGTNFWLFQTHKTACDAFVEIQVRDQVKKSSVLKLTKVGEGWNKQSNFRWTILLQILRHDSRRLRSFIHHSNRLWQKDIYPQWLFAGIFHSRLDQRLLQTKSLNLSGVAHAFWSWRCCWRCYRIFIS